LQKILKSSEFSEISILFILINTVCLSQEIQNIEKIYQNILNDENFKTEILSDTNFLYDDTLILFPTENYTLFKNLSFNGKQIVLYKINKKIDCPILRFDLDDYKNNSYKLKITIEKVVGSSGSCVFYKTKYYSCKLFLNGDTYELKDISIGTGYKQVKFM